MAFAHLARPFAALVAFAVHTVGLILRETRRRLTGYYQRGYALVPDTARVGRPVGPAAGWSGLPMAADPIYLPALWEGRVARVRHAVREHHAIRADGRRWWAERVEVVELLPSWVALGPAGDEALDIIRVTASLAPEAIVAARCDFDPGRLGPLLHGDAGRRRIWDSVRQLVDQLGTDRFADQPTLGLHRRTAAGRPGDGALRATALAAFAAAFVDELPLEEVGALSADWLRLVDLPPDRAILEGASPVARVTWRTRDLVHAIDRHPNVALSATIGAAFVALFVYPLAAILLMLLAPVVVVPAALGQVWFRGRRIRRRAWRPTASVEAQPVAPEALRQAMARATGGSHPILVRRLRRLLGRAVLWVPMRGPRPTDLERWLAWKRRNDEPLPVAISRGGDGRVLVCFTDAERHRRLPPTSRPAWTVGLTYGEAARAAAEWDADAIVIDPGSRSSIRLDRLALAHTGGVALAAANAVANRHSGGTARRAVVELPAAPPLPTLRPGAHDRER